MHFLRFEKAITDKTALVAKSQFEIAAGKREGFVPTVNVDNTVDRDIFNPIEGAERNSTTCRTVVFHN